MLCCNFNLFINHIMKKLTFTLIASGVFCCMHAASANDYARLERACKNSGEELIAKLSQDLVRADQVLPNIPPEEAKYINDEGLAIKRIYRSKDQKYEYSTLVERFSKLSSRPLYKVSNVRLALTNAKESLNKISSSSTGNMYYPKSVEADKLYRAIQATEPIATYVTEVAEFSRMDTPPGMQNKQVVDLHGEAILMPGILQDFMICKLEKAMLNK